MQCPDCGYVNHAEWYFCTGCGGSLDTVRAAAQTTPGAAAPARQTIRLAAPPAEIPAAPRRPAAPRVPAPRPANPASVPPFQAAIPTPFQPTLQPAYGMAALQPAYGQAAPYQVNVYVHNNVAPAAPPVIVPAAAPAGPGLLIGVAPNFLVRVVWFLCIGLWLGMLTTAVAWGLIVSVIGMPLGVMLLNRLPKIMTLRPTRPHTRIEMHPGGYSVSHGGPTQHSLLLRGVYFLAAGWWLSAIWLMVAWALVGLTFGLGLPLAFWMFNRTGAVTTLARH